MRFKECERIATIAGSVSFGTALSAACNPGLAASFPWLSGHAALFENYKVHSLVYRYKNLKGTSSAGNVILSFDYDTLDSAPADAIAATQSTHYVDGAPWRIFQLKVPTDNRKLFTRTGSITGVDLKTYDMGSLHVSTEGCADTTDHGYLEVEYDIEFYNKQPSTGGSVTQGSTSIFHLSADQTVTADAIVQYDATVLNGAGITNTAGSFSLPAGNYAYHLAFSHVTGVIAQVSIHVDGAAVVPPEDLVDPADVVEATYDLRTNFGVLVLSATSTITVEIDWTSGTSVLGKDVNRISFMKV
jgi:hypothetical protein